MRRLDVVVVDYGRGNLRSVHKAFERLRARAEVAAEPDRLAAGDRLVLPGVGAFGDAMRELEDRGLVAPIRDHVASGRPFLGICLGLQVLFETGREGGEPRGLGILAGDVVPLAGSPGLKIPHMGWNRISRRNDSPLIAAIPDGSYFYFVHSYVARPADDEIVAATCTHGFEFTAAISRDNVHATQFHPEKSQDLGLALLAAFLKM